MQFARATNTAALFLLLGTCVPAYAQHDQKDGQQGKQKDEKQGKPAKQQHAQQSHHQQSERTQQQAVAWQQQRGWVQQGGGWQGHSTWQQSGAQEWNSEHRTWGQRGGYGGYYIPQDRYVRYFGNKHSFRMRSRPVIYMGYPRFSYGGYSFLLLDPWPYNWGENWYGTDDVYIDYNNGYYLYNRRHPGFGLAITVAL